MVKKRRRCQVHRYRGAVRGGGRIDWTAMFPGPGGFAGAASHQGTRPGRTHMQSQGAKGQRTCAHCSAPPTGIGSEVAHPPTHPPTHPRPQDTNLADGHGQHAVPLVVNVLADEVDTACVMRSVARRRAAMQNRVQPGPDIASTQLTYSDTSLPGCGTHTRTPRHRRRSLWGCRRKPPPPRTLHPATLSPIGAGAPGARA
jgi:hypothetical protein